MKICPKLCDYQILPELDEYKPHMSIRCEYQDIYTDMNFSTNANAVLIGSYTVESIGNYYKSCETLKRIYANYLNSTYKRRIISICTDTKTNTNHFEDDLYIEPTVVTDQSTDPLVPTKSRKVYALKHLLNQLTLTETRKSGDIKSDNVQNLIMNTIYADCSLAFFPHYQIFKNRNEFFYIASLKDSLIQCSK